MFIGTCRQHGGGSCYGGFKGVDSCDLLEVGNYARTNVLCEKNILSLSLHVRPDIRCKLSQLVYYNSSISIWTAEIRTDEENCITGCIIEYFR